MLYQSIKWGIVSLLIILLIHYLYSFFKNTLTVPKVRYMPQNKLKNDKYDKNNKYHDKYDKYDKHHIENKKSSYNDCSQQETNMKNELSDFLSKIKKKVKNVTKKNLKFKDNDPDVNSDEDDDIETNHSIKDDINENTFDKEINIDDIVDEDLTQNNVNANDIGYDTYTSF